MNYKLGVLLFSLLTIYSCKDSKNSEAKDMYERDNKIFSKYLHKAFGEEIAFDSTDYLLVSEDACPGCVMRLLLDVQRSPKSKFIISKIGFQKFMHMYAFDSDKFLIDTTGEINQLKFHNGNVGIVRTSSGRVFNTIQVEPSSVDSVLAIIKK